MYGANATISVWDPTVESRDEFSLSLIWITSGSYNKNNLNSIEAGWQVCSKFLCVIFSVYIMTNTFTIYFLLF